ncbi:MAG TPA: ribosome-associated translation inhibitor RaiA [Candidatus Binatia bacterium]|nr:ribosome-associated translation inhibitor RaiA [Candidatus Binatia bacterium]
MQILVTFRHMDASDALRSYATEKIERVASKYLKNAVEAHVILEAAGHRKRFQAEFNVHASNFDISAHSDSDDMYSAIDFAVDKVEAQVRKHKDRINDRKGRASVPEAATNIPVDVLGPHDDEGGPRVIETDSMPAKPLSVEDAVLQLDLSHSEFLVFRNSATNTISVVYRRRDGNYGLIVPND